jgi:hypothetical protein
MYSVIIYTLHINQLQNVYSILIKSNTEQPYKTQAKHFNFRLYRIILTALHKIIIAFLLISDMSESSLEEVDWINPVRSREPLLGLVNTVINFPLP